MTGRLDMSLLEDHIIDQMEPLGVEGTPPGGRATLGFWSEAKIPPQ